MEVLGRSVPLADLACWLCHCLDNTFLLDRGRNATNLLVGSHRKMSAGGSAPNVAIPIAMAARSAAHIALPTLASAIGLPDLVACILHAGQCRQSRVVNDLPNQASAHHAFRIPVSRTSMLLSSPSGKRIILVYRLSRTCSLMSGPRYRKTLPRKST